MKRTTTKKRRVFLANTLGPGTHASGISQYTDAAVTERWLLAKRGTLANRVAICGAADTPLGLLTDESAALGDPVNLQVFGQMKGTVFMVSSGAITQDSLLEPAANGRVQALGAGAGTHHVVGRALEAAAGAGEVIECDPFYFLRVI